MIVGALVDVVLADQTGESLGTVADGGGCLGNAATSSSIEAVIRFDSISTCTVIDGNFAIESGVAVPALALVGVYPIDTRGPVHARIGVAFIQLLAVGVGWTSYT
jgi:hypothetical protein